MLKLNILIAVAATVKRKPLQKEGDLNHRIQKVKNKQKLLKSKHEKLS